MKIYAIRHAPPVVNGVCYGRLDIDVQAVSANEITALSQQLPQNPLSIYSSTSKRCRDIALQYSGLVNVLPLKHDARLCELDFGGWEGAAWSAIECDAIDEWAENPVHFLMPNGESFSCLISRVKAWLSNLNEASGCEVVVFTHAGVIKALHSILNDRTAESVVGLKVGYLSVNVFEFS